MIRGNQEIPIIFRPANPGLEKFFGRLEAELMNIIWNEGPMTVKRALYHISKKQNYAYTTVMTVLNRLTQKNLLTRRKKGHSFIYTPIMSKNEYLEYALEKIISGLLEDFNQATKIAIDKAKKPTKRKK